jgi:hypothetical protein
LYRQSIRDGTKSGRRRITRPRVLLPPINPHPTRELQDDRLQKSPHLGGRSGRRQERRADRARAGGMEEERSAISGSPRPLPSRAPARPGLAAWSALLADTLAWLGDSEKRKWEEEAGGARGQHL